MVESSIRLYGIALSHPVLGVQGMLERKRLTYRYVELLGGAHPLALFALRFTRATVPAMRLPEPVPRRLIRCGLRHHLAQRRWFADVASL